MIEKVKKKNPLHYDRWSNMLGRCFNKNRHDYPRYGGRGIFVCEEWRIWKNFEKWCLDTYIEGRSLDRIDNDKGYSPDNCRWATPSEQRFNARFTEKHAKALQKVREKKFLIYGDPKTRKQKRCRKCKVFLNFEKFHKDKYTADGLFGVCISCAKEHRNYVPKTRNKVQSDNSPSSQRPS